MQDILRRIRLPLLFVTLLAITLSLMLRDRRALRGGEEGSWFSNALLEIVVPIERALTWPADRVADLWSRYVDLVDVGDENQRLRAQLAEVREENLQFREALVASGQLAQIVEMRHDFEVPLLPAQVVGQDISPWFNSLLLDRGRSSRVHSGMPIVAVGGLVGLVSATSPHTARAMLILDRRSALDVIIQRSRARGLLRGTGGAELEFDFMVRGDDVRPGDVVISSGVGGVYPKGLRVGEVTSVHTEPTELVHTASVEPAVDFGRLEQVFVLLQRGPTMALLYGGDGEVPEPPTGTDDR